MFFGADWLEQIAAERKVPQSGGWRGRSNGSHGTACRQVPRRALQHFARASFPLQLHTAALREDGAYGEKVPRILLLIHLQFWLVGTHRLLDDPGARVERFRRVSQEQARYRVSKTRVDIVEPRKYRKPRRGTRRQESRRARGGRGGGSARGRALRRKYPANTDTTFHAASTCPADADNTSPGLKSWQHRADAVRRRQCPPSSI